MPSSGKSPEQIVIIDYGMGNLHSVKKRFSQFGCHPTASSDPKAIAAADKLIFPGVGHFQHAMRNLKEMGLIDILNEAVRPSA
jgi:glutamine amidotransferase